MNWRDEAMKARASISTPMKQKPAERDEDRGKN
jgi:hypothetical protein